mgnify:CR=1 FL=1
MVARGDLGIEIGEAPAKVFDPFGEGGELGAARGRFHEYARPSRDSDASHPAGGTSPGPGRLFPV